MHAWTLFGLSVLALVYAASAQSKTTQKWIIKPYHGAYAPGKVSAQSNKNQNVDMTSNKAQLNANANVQGKGTFSGGRQGTAQKVQAKNAKGLTANGDQSNAKSTGVRTADAGGKYQGTMKQTKSGNNQKADLSLQSGQKMDTTMYGNKEKFDAKGSKGNTQGVDPSAQTKTDGNGVITRNSDTYNYKISKTSAGEANAQLTNIGKGPTKNTYTCKGQKVGVSNCVDQNGLKAGEVVAQPDGTVIVKKTIAKGVDVPIGKSKATKSADGKTVVNVNDGLMQAQSGNYKQRDCSSDYGKKTSKVKASKPFKFIYNSQTQNGMKTFTWPDCITFGGKITLDPGVDANRLAFEFQMDILPAGRLKCVDQSASPSVNRPCYYCNACMNTTKKYAMLANSDGSNICKAKGGGTYDITVTACPPPEAFDKAVCSGFTKSDPNYFKKKGDIQGRLLIWERPANEAQLTTDFYNKLNNDIGGINKKSMQLTYAASNPLSLGKTVTDYDLKEAYIEKNGKTELVGCVEGTTNYTLTGQKINTSFLLEAGSVAASPKSLWDSKRCPAVDTVNQNQATAEAAAVKKTAGKSGVNWQSLFGRR